MPTDMEILNDETAAVADATGDPTEAAASAGAAPNAPAAEPQAQAGAQQQPETYDPDWGDQAAEPAQRPAAAQPQRTDGQQPQPTEEAGDPLRIAGASERFGTGALTRMLRDNPRLGEAAQADPRLRSTLYAMARRSGELAELQGVVPTVAAAREAAESHRALGEFDRLYFGGQPEEFLSRLYAAQVRNGQSSGAYERVMQYAHNALLDELDRSAAASGDERLAEAVSAIREVLPWAQRAQQGDAANLAPGVRAEIERGRAAQQQLSSLRAQQAQATGQAQEAWLDETAAEAARQVVDYLTRALQPTAFTDFEKRAIAEQAFRNIGELAAQDPGHTAALDETFARLGATPAARQELVGRHLAWAKANARDAMEPVVRAAGAARKARAAAADGKRAGWATEPRGAGGAPGAQRPSGPELEKALRQKLGRRPTDLELLNDE